MPPWLANTSNPCHQNPYAMHSNKYKGLPYTMGIIKRKLRARFGRLYRWQAKWHGIRFEGPCVFIGKPAFKISPGTEVTIGAGCEFLSGGTDNLIGINRPCIISTYNPGTKVTIGSGTGCSGTVIGAFAQVRIGRNVKCGANTLITDSDWHPEDPRSGAPRPVVIGDNVWLGVNSTVLKGVTIGENAVIGAHSVVTKDIPPNVVAAGNPCRVVKSIKRQHNTVSQ